MYLFLFLLFPVVSFFYAFREYKNFGFENLKKRFFVAVFGALCGTALCAIFEFVIFVPVFQRDKFAMFTLIRWIFSSLIPFLFFVLFLLWSKDEWQVRAGSFLYFALPFCCVYVPFYCFTQEVCSAFVIFVLPVLVLFELFAVNREFSDFFCACSVKSPEMLLSAFLILLESLAPCVIYSLSYFNFFAGLWIVLSIAFVFLCMVRAKINLKTALAVA